jgi:hypothetical protein
MRGHRGRILLKHVLKEIWFNGMDWIQTAHDGVHCQAAVNTVANSM